MTTLGQSAPGSATRRPDATTRQQRRRRRHRLAWEQSFAVVVLAAAFAATVVLLGLQWLHAGSSGGPGTITTPSAEVRFMFHTVLPG